VGIGGNITEDVRERENDEIVDTSSEGSIENAPKLKRVTVRKRRQGCGDYQKIMKALF
jgi:hypothetical protein